MARKDDVYARAYDEKKPVICVDEKPVALIGDTRDRILPEKPGDILKKYYEYKRNGSVNVFCGVEPKTGVYIVAGAKLLMRLFSYSAVSGI